MSKEFEQQLRAALNDAGTSGGSFGRLTRVAAQAARLQGRLKPLLRSAGLMVFAGDHGIAKFGISSGDAGRTRQRAQDLASGQGLLAHLAGLSGLPVAVVDAAIEEPAPEGSALIDRRICAGTAPFFDGPAMTPEQRDAALAAGEALAASSPHDVLGMANMGRGGSGSAALLVHRITGTPLGSLIARGEGLDEEGLFRKHDYLTQASERVAPGADAPDVLAEFGGIETAMMVGAMLGATKAKKLIVIDGPGACVAALIAAQLSPQTRNAMVFSHLTLAPAHRVALDALAAHPLLELDVDMGDGAGVVLAWPLVRSALALLSDP